MVPGLEEGGDHHHHEVGGENSLARLVCRKTPMEIAHERDWPGWLNIPRKHVINGRLDYINWMTMLRNKYRNRYPFFF